jgi:SAM-dependent methyltransferase
VTTAPRTSALAACPTGRHQRLQPLFRAQDRVHGVPGEYAYDTCLECGTVFQNPRVDVADMGACYPPAYYDELAAGEPAEGAGGGRWRPALRAGVRQAVTDRGRAPLPMRLLAKFRALRERAFAGLPDPLIPRRTPPGRALDAGCGAGRLLCMLARAGWAAEGLEWDPRAAARARASSGRPVTVGDFLGADLRRGSYALVVLHHVLEHLPDPEAALSRAQELLAPGGTAVFVYPNPGALGARLFGPDWYPWEVPRHLVFPSRRALASLARRAGLEPARMRTAANWSAPYLLAASRALRHGRSARGAQPALRDRAWALLERALCGLGVPCGEEVVAVFVKP